jgi:hypothetical protein
MVGALGMTESPVSFVAMEEGLNERNVVAKVLSDPDGRARTDRLLKEAKQAVREQLDLHRPLVEALRGAPQPARPPPGRAGRAGRSGPGRVGSPPEVS